MLAYCFSGIGSVKLIFSEVSCHFKGHVMTPRACDIFFSNLNFSFFLGTFEMSRKSWLPLAFDRLFKPQTEA